MDQPLREYQYRLYAPNGGRQEVSTPEYILSWVRFYLGPDYFDPCPINPTVDGLTVPWQPHTYVNPPYGEIGKWMEKAWQEIQKGNTHIALFLVPFLCHHNYWDTKVFGRACSVLVVTNPVKFVGYGNRFGDALSLVIFTRNHDGSPPLLDWFQFPGWPEEHYKKTSRKGTRKYRSQHGKQNPLA